VFELFVCSVHVIAVGDCSVQAFSSLMIFSHFSRPIATTVQDADSGIVPDAMILSTPDNTLAEVLVEQIAVVMTVKFEEIEALQSIAIVGCCTLIESMDTVALDVIELSTSINLIAADVVVLDAEIDDATEAILSAEAVVVVDAEVDALARMTRSIADNGACDSAENPNT